MKKLEADAFDWADEKCTCNTDGSELCKAGALTDGYIEGATVMRRPN